ncbi:hypothetical protein JAAARDRAFT_253436 [Jaapia argillacea MUCL 33604]|uniref:DUF7514 domain-containing protein n=1 Tax=Jaapia argillacea MUCL 33604 TaxID=933084 RepID=A0A067Q5X3_9AGAM|nr:hypothetical protein JAAARDRAFT_253436 [Jaapia argillacea MUCL 33604]
MVHFPDVPPPPPPKVNTNTGPTPSPGPYSPSSSTSTHSSGYVPVQFDIPGGGEEFYGQLLDQANRPTQVLSRLADALFFYMDQCCDIVQLRGTQHIEPQKYVWMLKKLGTDKSLADPMEYLLRSYYDAGAIPYKVVVVNGVQIPVVDRRGWLHVAVFDIRSNPDEALRHWTKCINTLPLLDPATTQRFPAPIPRSAFPRAADFYCSQAVLTWRSRGIAEVHQRQRSAMMQRQRNKMMVGGAVKLASNLFGGGGLGGGGFSGTGL